MEVELAAEESRERVKAASVTSWQGGALFNLQAQIGSPGNQFSLCSLGGIEAKGELSRTLAAGASQIQDSSPAVGGPCGKESPTASWQQEAACPSAPPGSPIPTENGEEAHAMASELASMGERLEKENQELRLALGKAETRMQEKERELWNLQGQLDMIRAELAQWKKQRGGQTESSSLESRGRRPSVDVGDLRQSRHQQKGLLGTEKVPSSGSRRSISSSRLEQPAEKRGAHTKLKGFPSPSSRAQSTERGREELQALRTEVLTLRRRLDASESQRKTLLEACWQQEKSRAWAQERQLGPMVGAAAWQKTKDSPEIHGDCQAPRSKGQALVLATGGEVSVAEEVEEDGGAVEPETAAELGKELASDVETSETGEDAPAPATRQAHREAEAEGQGGRTPDLEGNVEGLQENLLDLASGKAQAEAQAILAQEKLQLLQATLGRQTERLARAMETQSRHVEELLADAEEKEQLMRSLRQELEETKKALEMADAEGQRLRALLGQREAEGHHAEGPSNTLEVRGDSEISEVPLVSAQLQGGMLSTADVGLAGRLPEEKQVQPGIQEQWCLFSWVTLCLQLEASLAQLQQENLVLREELATWEAWRQKRGEEDTTGPFELVGSGNGREAAETADVPDASQKRECLSQGSRRNVQTQTEGPECGHRRRERVSVAFDDTQYEPYGLPEVVMKGFADIPSGPSCPYVLRRGILGSAPVAQLAPRAEPEEDSPEAEEGTGV
ncbi:GRIP and coiled-coil domain-containing protein 1-like [Lacerta agilis]|uniref:GRIP and coiled-coil domain-containing protein 1-like n=1 Tax=Lacerta agilis TaxID=80427 RepID=UPI0014196923|nr:GRIP and coiled-coil domain-containing protein 1-like [Lacerta agilis]